jgi:extracellular factor (EF) 3-hydroxypalmitic acid methyl ester biosynthesis protein
MQYSPRIVPHALRLLHEPQIASPLALLDQTHNGLLDGGDVAFVVERFSDGLWWLRQTVTGDQWREIVALARAHPLMGLLHEDPLIRRAFVKPRGYPGDAPLMDMIYDGREASGAVGASMIGLAMLDRDIGLSCCTALRERRDFLAGMIDRLASATNRPCILSAACGHLREASLSVAVQQNRLGRLVALDQDADSLAEVDGEHAGLGIETMHRSVKAIMDGTFEHASFDMVYAAGLYETLSSRFATRLTHAFFHLLRPGGRLVIDNFARGIYDCAYLEAVGDWFLVYRDAAELFALADPIDSREIAMKRVYTRLSPDVFYLEIRKRRTTHV